MLRGLKAALEGGRGGIGEAGNRVLGDWSKRGGLEAGLRLRRESAEPGACEGWLHLLRSLLDWGKGSLAGLLKRHACREPGRLGDETGLDLGKLLRLERCRAPWRHAHLHLVLELRLGLGLGLWLGLHSHGRLVLLDRFEEVDEIGIRTLDGRRLCWWRRLSSGVGA